MRVSNWWQNVSTISLRELIQHWLQLLMVVIVVSIICFVHVKAINDNSRKQRCWWDWFMFPNMTDSSSWSVQRSRGRAMRLVRVEHGPSAVTNCEYCVLLSIREDCVCVCVWGRKPSGSWSIDHLSHTVSRSRQTPGPLTDNYNCHTYTHARAFWSFCLLKHSLINQLITQEEWTGAHLRYFCQFLFHLHVPDL